MVKKLTLFIAFFSLIFSLSCNKDKKAANTKPVAKAEVKKGVTPIADDEIAVMETDYGTIKIELYSNIAPKMVARFKELAREGFYNGIAFHRINKTVVQAGNAATKPDAPPSNGREVDSGKPNVEAEFTDVKYDTGIVGAARLGGDVNSQNSQFFITLTRTGAESFDGNYTVFGKVIEGMNNVITISGVPVAGEKPIDPVRIKSVTIQPK